MSGERLHEFALPSRPAGRARYQSHHEPPDDKPNSEDWNTTVKHVAPKIIEYSHHYRKDHGLTQHISRFSLLSCLCPTLKCALLSARPGVGIPFSQPGHIDFLIIRETCSGELHVSQENGYRSVMIVFRSGCGRFVRSRIRNVNDSPHPWMNAALKFVTPDWKIGSTRRRSDFDTTSRNENYRSEV